MRTSRQVQTEGVTDGRVRSHVVLDKSMPATWLEAGYAETFINTRGTPFPPRWEKGEWQNSQCHWID